MTTLHRVLGASLAGAICLLVAIVLAAAADAFRNESPRGVLGLCAIGAAIGVPVGGLLGWCYTPAAADPRGRGRLALIIRIATVAVPVGGALLATAMSMESLLADPGLDGLFTTIVSAGLFLLFGLIYFGLPAWVLAAALGSIWVALLTTAVELENRLSRP